MSILENVKSELIKEIEKNSTIIEDAIKEENGEYKDLIKIEDIKEKIIIFKEPEKIYNENNIAVQYNGNYEITIYLALYTILTQERLYLYYDAYPVLNTVIIEMFKNVLKKLNINANIFYGNEYNQEKLIKDQEKYEKIIYVGDYFECQKLQHFIKKPIKYNNYGYIKMYIDSEDFKQEYVQIMKYAYIHNIIVENFDTIEALQEELKEFDTIVIYTKKSEQIEKIKEHKDIYINQYPFENYTFKI